MDNEETEQPAEEIVVETVRCRGCNGEVDMGNESLCRNCGECEDCCPSMYCEGCRSDVTSCSRDGRNWCNSCDRCSQCHRDTRWTCENCGNIYCGPDANDNLGCSECTTCDNCDCVCPGRDSDGGVFDYSTNVVRHLGAQVPDGVRTYGIELEFECNNSDAKERIASNVAMNYALSSKWVPKEDGSLSRDGVELVSAPMTLDKLREAIVELFEIGQIAQNVRRSTSCGTHIHVGRDSISARTIARAWAPWAYSERKDPDMPGVLTALAGRKGSHWANWTCRAPVALREEYGEKAGRIRSNDHYAAISTSNHYPTYEWRMFAGATRQITALRYLDTVDCLLSIAEETHGLDVCFKASTLLTEIGKRVERYPALQATYQDPRKQLGKFFDTINAAYKGTPRKMRPQNEKTGVNVASSSTKLGLRRAMRLFSRIATPPPKAVYVAEKPIVEPESDRILANVSSSSIPEYEYYADSYFVTQQQVWDRVRLTTGTSSCLESLPGTFCLTCERAEDSARAVLEITQMNTGVPPSPPPPRPFESLNSADIPF
jgi:hypothetical protein